MSLLARKLGEKKRRGTPSDFLIIGLGNPGPEFEGTRHNVGAECVAVFALRHNKPLAKPSLFGKKIGQGDCGT